jgi:hypothetical protein
MTAPTSPIPPITVLYTVGLRGELRILPYLFTLIKAELAAPPGPVVLVDLGESCRQDWPICRATEGRATLVALDGMGYDGFYLGADEPLYSDSITQAKLRETVLTAVLTPGESKDIRKKYDEGLYVGIRSVGGADPLELDGSPDAQTMPDPTDPAKRLPIALTVHLARGVALASRVIEPRAVVIEDRREDRIPALGRVDIRFDTFGEAVVYDQRRIAIPAGTRPDPSLSSLVEFIESEAEWTGRKKSIE